MTNNEINLVTKIMGIIGVIFTLIALLTPWGDSIYTFGLLSTVSSPFYIIFFETQRAEFIFFAIAMIIIFILTLVTLFLGISTIKNIDRAPTNKFLTLGILLIVDIILYVIAVSIVSGGASTGGAYSIGFIMCIIAAIMFFIVYGIKKMYMPVTSPGSYQQPMYTQPRTYAQPQQPPPPVHPQQQPPPQPQQQAVQKKTVQKFCSNCGAQITPNSRFCPSCGNQL